ncbi:Shedu immune nuclease family protein [Pseudomonas juntendi]|uniref:Shedu immune nuclease family protein n=1 Tax=Pseudomonas juntendi TaxID=2666183 RepID=UPI001F3F9E0F|nr:Shedu immune nuclease family protein [Pseudomonas juntendi]MCO7055672.1 DUF4263 domain-containing protein [Pseudomonas juntendi]UJM14968.1 DUF4263 domain-containing protein [Pseudomonas juntendi]UXA41153.1 DUF4263 domain-containing protein [Pseudomonas juntendi]
MADGEQQHDTRWTDDDVLTPSFYLARLPNENGFSANLYLQIFEQVEAGSWQSLPEEQWHLLASIDPGWITMYPIYTNPHTQRYRSPRHGNVACIIYETRLVHDVPDNAEDALLHIDLNLPGKLFNSCDEGLGLVKQLAPLWRGLRLIPHAHTLVICSDGGTSEEGGAVFVREAEVDQCRRACMRISRAKRRSETSAQLHWVMQEVFAGLVPNLIFTGQRIESPSKGAKTVRSAVTYAARQERRSQLNQVKTSVGLLAQEAPRELYELHAQIERVTLAKMIERYQQMLGQELPESHWQRFFEDNMFILSMVFARPVSLLHTQFHARGSMIHGAGAHIGDLLFAQGRELAIVEIKKPSTPLMQSRPYRNQDVYGPHLQLSGAITQVLHQQGLMRSNWLSHLQDKAMRDLHPDTARCVVIAGTKPTEESRRHSFELFRNACKDVEVVTFDELLGKLQLLAEHLTPAEPKPVPDVF